MADPPTNDLAHLPGNPEDRLDSWKDIAAHLKRDVSTVQRWEKREGMPVHRHLHDKLGSVFAFRTELDAWSRSRSSRPPTPAAAECAPRARRHVAWLALAGVTLAALAGVLWLREGTDADRNPLAAARFTPLTDFEGAEHAAALSRDGNFVAFLSDRDGPTDVWVSQVGTGQFHNLTGGAFGELVNPPFARWGSPRTRRWSTCGFAAPRRRSACGRCPPWAARRVSSSKASPSWTGRTTDTGSPTTRRRRATRSS